MKRLGASYWEGLPLGPGVELLTKDVNGVFALGKPDGVLSHPNSPRDEPRSLLTAPYQMEGEYFEWRPDGEPAAQRAYLLNRLDSGTSGVLLVTSSEPLAQTLRLQFKQQKVRKLYQALVFGAPTPPVQVWRDRLAIQKRDGVVRTETAGNVPSESQIRVLKIYQGIPPLALIQLEPKTGRSHQLRVQCSTRHLPIVGDATYGNFRANREFARSTGLKRLFLHSSETQFSYLWQGRTWSFRARADLPAAFEEGVRDVRR